ncbi:hypothetical protein EDD11_000759 [Mortierella claussenii]|nr:hypothetical protein EDD11_000759 [Mortierella claussenii]
MTQVQRQGRGNNNKALRLDLHREGYEEECYFDFTLSPIFLKDGSVGGILALVQEVTQSVLNQRRLTTLNQFSKQAPLIQSIDGAYSMITTILQESNNLDIPFSIVYRTKELSQETASPPHTHGTFFPSPSTSTSLHGGNSPAMTTMSTANENLPMTGNQAGTANYSTSTSIIKTMEDELAQEGFGVGGGSSVHSNAVKSKIRLIRSHFSAGLPPGKKDTRRVPQSAILCSTSFDRNLEVVNYGGVTERIFSKATSTRHIPDSLLITPEEYEPLDPSDPVYDDPWAWPLRSVLADGIPRLVTLPKSTHKLARALLLPILENPSVLESRITTILIVGINPFQMLDNQYLDFLALLVANIASLLHFGRSREEERKSTEAMFELNKTKISFFQNVSHELRTPLTLMLAPLDDVLNQTPENAPTRQSLEMVRRNSRRLLKLVNTLLQFSRVEAGKGHAIFEETDLTKVTREISANFESVARGFGLDYIINCESLDQIPGGIWVDQAMWGGIILNLIGNAFKHTWEGSVTVHQYSCKGKNGKEGVALDVKDTGVGIAAEHLHTLFGRFNRIENKQSRSHEGTGIGLSLVKELTEVHGGTVSVTSEVDKGTCFHLWIPAGRSHHSSVHIKLGDSKDLFNPGAATEPGSGQLKPPRIEVMNNKTDASMFVEEATQWIAHKALPGSTLTTSGTDSTEEENPENDDDAIHWGALDYMRAVGGSAHGGIRDQLGLTLFGSKEMNTDFEVSTLDLEESELTKMLIDSTDSNNGNVVIPENALEKIDAQIPAAGSGAGSSGVPRRSLSIVHSPKSSHAHVHGHGHIHGGHGSQRHESEENSNGISKEQVPSVMTTTTTNSVNNIQYGADGLAAKNQVSGMFDTSMNDDGGYGEQVPTAEMMGEAGEMADNFNSHQNKNKTVLPRTRSRRGYIIIVDDNNDMRSYLKEILGKDFRVRSAVDGLDAIRLISERLQQGKRIDLVLSDVAMPNMNGYELLKRLRGDTATMMTPFILLSARAGEEANVEGLDLGADDCLVKPFSARELLARVRSTIRLSDLRHELIREQRHALEMKQLIYSISVRIRSGLSLPQILDTASRELFKVIRCNAIRICRFRRVDQETGQHWVRFVSEVVKVGKPKILTPTDRLLPKGLEILDAQVSSAVSSSGGDHEAASDLRHVTNCQHPIFGAKSFISVALIYNRKVWGYLLASRDEDMVDWSQSEKLLLEQTGNQISLAIAHASLWELKKSQQVEMEAAHAANEAKSQILANTSHELRTPIGAIVGALSALEDTDYNLTGEQRDMVKIMQITSDVALSVINDLLDTAKLEAGAMSLNIKECPGLVETLEQSVRIFADKAGRKEVDLIMEPSEDLEDLEVQLQQGSVVWTDDDRLQQVIMNLIGNAVKFTAAGKVSVQCTLVNSDAPQNMMIGGGGSDVSCNAEDPFQQADSQDGNLNNNVQLPADAQVTYKTFRFEVSDTGIGIDPDFLKNHIFKSFAQYDQSMTRRFGGTGLGLAISKHLVMMNGGIVGVTSNVGQGSTFYFTWPIAIVNSPSSNASRFAYPQHGILTRPTLSPEIAFETRAIVVEPVPESRQVLGRILNQQNVQVTLYESCENVVQDELDRQRDLKGPDGEVLATNYRTNAHFFFCARSSTAEITVETARQLGMLFRQRNQEAKSNPQMDENYRDLVLSVILVVFSSPQGRYLAKDMIKRICADGLDETVQCRYIVKPVKPERIVECMQMMGSYVPYTRGMIGDSPEVALAGTLQHQGTTSRQSLRAARAATNTAEAVATAASRLGSELLNGYEHSGGFEGSQMISADDSVSLVSSDYDRDNNSNKNTPESSLLDPDGWADSPDVKHGSPLAKVDDISPGLVHGDGVDSSAPLPGTTLATVQIPTMASVNGIHSSGQHHQPLRSPAVAAQRRMRMKMVGDGLIGKAIASSGVTTTGGVGGSDKDARTSTDESAKSSNESAVFCNWAPRAAAGKRERRGKCVLCVEDNIINLRVVQYQLQKLGYDTQSACDGQVAVDIIKAQVELLGQPFSSESDGHLDDNHVDGNHGHRENGGMNITTTHPTHLSSIAGLLDAAVEASIGLGRGLGSRFRAKGFNCSIRQKSRPPGSSVFLSTFQSVPPFHLSVRSEVVVVIPEGNQNRRFIFDQSEFSLFIPAVSAPTSSTAAIDDVPSVVSEPSSAAVAASLSSSANAAPDGGTGTGIETEEETAVEEGASEAAAVPSPKAAAAPAVMVSGTSSLSSASSSPAIVSLETLAATTKAFTPTAATLMNNAAAQMLPNSTFGSNGSGSGSRTNGKRGKIDLILMDCAMPVKSGFDAASEIRAMGATSAFAANIPIIALTASAIPSTKEKCIASGMNGYLSKPTKLADLEAMLDQWIE